jgi:dihydrolipoamide dehydrogenase
MNSPKNNTDVAVIGGGPGGYAAAFMAADLGMDVTLIDPNANPGGVCLYRGCIPSKTLLHAARLIHEAAEAEKLGLTFARPKIDVDKLRSWKNDVVQKLTEGLGRLTAQRKITYVRGKARFADGTTLALQTADGASHPLAFKQAVVATGSYPVTLPGLPQESGLVLDSSSALALEEVPRSLLVIGGGYIGLELGTVYASLGSQVTVVEMTSGLLPGADRDLVNVLKKSLETQFEKILLNTMANDFKVQKNGIKVALKGPDNTSQSRLFNKVLVAVGRRPNSRDLGLEKAGVAVDEKGFITVDGQCRTSASHIFAIGDVIGEPMLAHKASHEGRLAAEIMAGGKMVFEPAAIPAVVFTDPEVAWAGLTEQNARAGGIDVKVVRFPWAASGRATAMGRTDGLTKLIIATETQRILGVGLVGSGAGEMIAEGVLAIEMGANATDLAMTIHPHPTLTETVMESAEMFLGTATHFYRPQRKK